MILNRPSACAYVCLSGVYASMSSQAHVHAYMSVYPVMFALLCAFVWLFVHVWACWKRCSPVCVCMCACVCPGATGANLHTVITRCQTPPHWLWHVNYTPCFHLLWWHNTHIKMCTVCICEFVCVSIMGSLHIWQGSCAPCKHEYVMSELRCVSVCLCQCI